MIMVDECVDGDDKTSSAPGRQQQLDQVDALPADLSYSGFDMLCSLISVLTYLFDLGMDVAVAAYFYHLGVSHGVYHYWYFGLTVSFILLPSLTMTGFSLRWYLLDADNSQLPSVPMWRWALRIVVLMLQIAPVLRYVDSMRYGMKSRAAAGCVATATSSTQRRLLLDKKHKYYTLMVYEDADATLLRLFECFMESAPQLVLQIYILIKDPHASKLIASDPLQASSGQSNTDVIIKSTILVVSVISSLVSLAWSLVVYHRSLRYTFPEKKNLNWSGSVFQFLWHFSSITARVLALSLFASIYPQWIGAVCAAHWLIMSGWVVCQRTNACKTRFEELLFSLVLGAVYVFSFFNAKEGRTRTKYLIYYCFCFCENTALIVFWLLFANHGLPPGQVHWYYYPGIAGHYLAFFCAILFMVIYYAFFHPTGVDVDLGCFRQRAADRSVVSRTRPERHEEPDSEAAAAVEVLVLASPLEPALMGNVRPLSRLSVSSPALDEQGAGSACGREKPSCTAEEVKMLMIHRAQSMPADSLLYHWSGRRHLKMMSGHERK